MPGQFIAALTKKLRSLGDLDEGDIKVIESVAVKGRLIPADRLLAREGDTFEHCSIVMSGYAYSSKTTPLGKRQILSFHIPGEIPDLEGFHVKAMDHDLTTLTECTLGIIPHDAVQALLERRNIAAALWRETVLQASISREWLLNVGQRSSLSRMVHLLLEIDFRLTAAGQAKSGSFQLPFTQSELADCLGISTVHVNRVLQHLKREGLVAIKQNTFDLLGHRELKKLGQFNDNYLRISECAVSDRVHRMAVGPDLPPALRRA